MTNMIEFACPHCSKNIRTNARYAGMKGQCPHCGKTVHVEGAAHDFLKPSEVETSASPSSTEANTLLAGLIGAAATLLLYLFFLVIRDRWLGQLFLERGPIQFIATFVACWGLAILVLKYRAVRHQLSYVGLELDFVPLEAGMQINSRNVATFLEHVDGLPKKARYSIVGRRIHGALEHFRARNSVPEVQTYLNTQATIDASTVDSGYTLLRAFIWAVPLLGFIGTVTGISKAVSGLSDSLKTSTVQEAVLDPAGANNPPAANLPGDQDDSGNLGAQMIKAMGGVTQGLSTAFDTTFVALVLAIVLLFPTESLKRVEYGMLDRIEAFTHETLLRRMSDDAASEALSPELARLLEPAFKRHQQWLIEWQKQIAELGNVIGGDFERHMQAVRQELRRSETEHAHEVAQVASQVAQTVERACDMMERWRLANAAAADEFRSSWEWANALQERLATNTEQMRGLSEQWKSFSADHALAEPIARLQHASESLDRSATQLAALIAGDQHHALVPVVPPVSRRLPIFGRFRR
jgi:biopolymer transport protein ExbB/TolQ/antitoxin component HigA of HigAB toxin-antitoxin module